MKAACFPELKVLVLAQLSTVFPVTRPQRQLQSCPQRWQMLRALLLRDVGRGGSYDADTGLSGRGKEVCDLVAAAAILCLMLLPCSAAHLPTVHPLAAISKLIVDKYTTTRFE